MSLDRAVERSLVGAVLLNPEALETLATWLEVDDFDGTAERQAYTAMLAIRAGGAPVTPETVDERLRTTLPTGTQLADAAYLVTAMTDTPEPERAAIYGRMVLELSIRRRVGAGAVVLRQEAERADTNHRINVAFASVDGVRREVERLHRRESLAASLHSVAPATDDKLQRLIRFPRSEELAAEQSAVQGLVNHPDVIEQVGRWLRTSDFGDDEAGALFGEIIKMHEQRNPIDRLTVAWRAARVGIEGPLTEALVHPTTDAQPTTDPVGVCRRVLEQSVKAALVATSEELEVVSRDPSLDSTTVAYTRLNALWPQQGRLIRASLSVAPPIRNAGL